MTENGLAPQDSAATNETPRRKLAAIMFTDLVGYTTLSQVSEVLSLSLLEKHRALLRGVFSRYGGREIRTMGDAFLVEFESALGATECAVDIQHTVFGYNLEVEDEKIFVRIGIHLGDVIHSQGDVLGNVVNIASRIEPLAEPGGICISGQVYDQIRDQTDQEWVELEPQKLKNVRLPFSVFKVVFHRSEPERGAEHDSADALSRVAIEVLNVICRQDMIDSESIRARVAVNRDVLSQTLDQLERTKSIKKLESQKGSVYYLITERGTELMGSWVNRTRD